MQPTRDEELGRLRREKSVLEGEVLVARRASDITAELVVEQFQKLEEILRRLEEAAEEEKKLRIALADKLAEAERRERELAEARTAAEAANRAKSSFLAMMSHEFRGAAFTLSNAGEGEARLSIVLEGLPGGTNPGYVTLQEVPFTDTPLAFGAEKNPPLALYDTSGPYTDPEAHIDLTAGLEPLRARWIGQRGDCASLSGLSSEFGRRRASDAKLDAVRFPAVRNPLRALPGANVTQMHYARRGIVTPDSFVIACIPNAQHWSMQARLNLGQFRYEERGLFDRTHIRWFTRTTIDEMFASCGFQIIDGRCRILDEPYREAALVGIRAFAEMIGADADRAATDATPLQYVVRAAPV